MSVMSLANYACADEPAHIFAYHADALTFLRSLPDEWVHCIITDPPYGLADHKPAVIATAITAWASGDRERVPDGRGFMGRAWDSFVPPPAVWDECLRVLKPGGHLAVFAGSRTVDLMGLSIRLAGFEMRDGIAAWLYGSGFPKSRDVGKAIDKAAGAEREAVGRTSGAQNHGVLLGDDSWAAPGGGTRWTFRAEYDATAPATDAAREWQGYGTALKPAHEPILLARKPLSGTIAANVLTHRTGAINVDATRIGSAEKLVRPSILRTDNEVLGKGLGAGVQDEPAGRWPTNVVLAHHPADPSETECHPDCQVAALDEQSGNVKTHGGGTQAQSVGYGGYEATGRPIAKGDQGGASRFFPTFRYQAKAPRSERPMVDGRGHPTVKPLGLMRWLVRLLVPGESNGTCGAVLDPFAGSGATLEAARLEGRRAVGVDADEHAVRLIAKRLEVECRIPEVDSAPEPTTTELLLAKAATAESIDALMELYEYAVNEGLWSDDVRAAFTARKAQVAA